MIPKAAMIFAAGFGTRMGPLSAETPKPMIHLNGRPMIDHAIDLVRSANIEHIVSNTHYLHERIAPHLASQNVAVLHETPDILETGGGLKNALPLLGNGPIVTLNPDAAWRGPNPIQTLLNAWQADMRALLLLVPFTQAQTTRDEGDFSLEHGVIQRRGPFFYTGAQIIRTDWLNDMPDQIFSLNRYWDKLAETGPLNGVVYEGDWCDIGHPGGLALAEDMLTNV